GDPLSIVLDDKMDQVPGAEKGNADAMGSHFANPNFPAARLIEYWDPQYKQMRIDQVRQIAQQGYDGVFLDVLDAYAQWEAHSNLTGIDYMEEMARFVIELATTIRTDFPEFQLVANNGMELYFSQSTDPMGKSYIDVISAQAKECTWYGENGPVVGDYLDTDFNYLNMARERGVEIISIDYPNVTGGAYGDVQAYFDAAMAFGALPNAYPVLLDGFPEINKLLHGQFPYNLLREEMLPVVVGTAMADTLSGTEGNDLLMGGSDPLLAGTSDGNSGGDDWLSGGGGHDRLYGWGGNDVLSGGAGRDVLSGEMGNDTLWGGDEADALYGGLGDDLLSGEGGGDRILGGDGTDTLSGGAGDDTLLGGAGIDTAWFSHAAGDYRFTATADGMQVSARSGGDGEDWLVDVERLQFADRLLYLDGANNAPIVSAHPGWSLLQGENLTITREQLLAQAVDLEGNSLSVTSVLATGGTLTQLNETTWLLNPAVDFSGTLSLDFEVHDGSASTWASASVTVSPVNHAPTVTLVPEWTLEEDGNGTILAVDLLTGSVDGDGDLLVVSGLTVDSGTLSHVGDGVWRYDPDPDFHGEVALSWQVNDGEYSIAASGRVTVTPVNDAPVSMNPLSFEINLGDALLLTDTALLQGATDADGDLLSVGNRSLSQGIVVDSGDGSWTLIPEEGYLGTMTLLYEIGDGMTVTPFQAEITVNPRGAVITGSSTDDTLYGSAEVDTLLGGEGNDTLGGDGGDDYLFGATGDDLLAGDAGADRLFGGEGQDTLYGWTGDDLLEGGAGDDVLAGDDGHDSLRGGTGADELFGWNGNDLLEGGAGADVLSGEADNDTLWGGDDNDSLYGGAGSDVLAGGSGDDGFYGDGGADQMDGGEGFDFVSYQSSTAGVVVDWTMGSGTGGDAQGDAYAGIERVIGSAYADTLIGSAAQEFLEGGNGADLLMGGGGADSLIGGSGIDTASYSGSAGAVTINLGTGIVSGGDAEGDSLVSIENLTGSLSADTLTGSTAANVLQGGAGNDRLDGSGGNDTLYGGDGADTLIGGNGTDTASYAMSGTGVTVNLTSGSGSGGEAQGDTLTTIENLTGSQQGDTLTGSSAINVLDGGAGDDLLDGAGGNDILMGGSGVDTLIGGGGVDLLTGGANADQYRIGRGGGQDLVNNAGQTGTGDQIWLEDGIAWDQLWFRQNGNDLSMEIIGTSDGATIQGWYADAANRVDRIETTSGAYLLESQIQQLVNAMAAFAPPAQGETSLSQEYRNTLEPVLAASWQQHHVP
ncbi:MAG: cadherin-like domain-containing protein, partial [Magnetococcales bacterium]|nr:cadherin-like domain-containing protein [Magnetococcales bacterium]